jgi:fumarate reductase flavoprotein subunit
MMTDQARQSGAEATTGRRPPNGRARERVETFDVVIVGAGAAGMMAAVEAHDRGAEVVVLQKLPEPGGKSFLAIGSITAAGTSMQAAHGIVDSPEAFLADVVARVDLDALPPQARMKLRTVVARSGDAVERLLGLGVTFSGPHPEWPGEAYRLHTITPDVRTLVSALAAQARRRGIRIRGDWPVDRLLTDDAGGVIGVAGSHGVALARRGVVLATGDFSAPPRLGGQSPVGSEWAIRPWATGDGQLMAQAVGAALSEFKAPIVPQWRTLDWPHIRISHDVFEAGAVVVDRSGAQVCDERKDPDVGPQLAAAGSGDTFLVFDQTVMDRIATAADDSAHARDGWATKGKIYIGTFPGVGYAYIKDMVGAGYARTNDTVEGLARPFAIDPAGLAAGLAKRGIDKPPFFCAGPFQVVTIIGPAGVNVDSDTRVLRPDGSPIAGLYAAGAVTGRASSGHGYGLGWAVVSGRIAGEAVARRAGAGTPSNRYVAAAPAVS